MSGTEVEPMRVLVVDDDARFRDLMTDGLTESGIRATVAAEAPAALAILDAKHTPQFDAILLDVMMPGASGWELLEAVRERTDTPVIFVTARESVEERVRGLRLGADDYVIKPFAFAELLARIDVVVRRRRDSNRLHASDVTLDLTTHRAAVKGKPLELSPTEFSLLRVLLAARNRVVTRQELLREVWQVYDDPGTNIVDVNVARLRRKLEHAGGPWLQTVRGQGYAFPRGPE